MTIDSALFFALLLVFTRCSAMLFASPMFGAQNLPIQIRIFATLALSAALALTRPQPALANVPGTGCPVFPADNIWHTDISSLPVNPHSAACE